MICKPAREVVQTVAPGASGTTRVSGPGQNASARRKASAEKMPCSQRRFKARDVGDKRIEVWPCLRRINAGDGGVRGRVGGQAVNGLGRKRDETAATQDARRLGNARRVRRHFFCAGRKRNHAQQNRFSSAGIHP